MNTYEPEWNYGPAFFDARHNFVFSANYELPFGKGRRWGGDSSTLVDALIGGWRLGGNFQARSGFPITVTDGAARSQQGQRGNERPNCVADPHPSNQNIDNWLDINAFQRVPLGTWGNCGIGVARAPKFRNIDAVLAKRFNTGGERYFEFRVEAFNLTNTPSFGPPARDINAPNTFGRYHQHGQHRSNGGTRVQVLFLIDRPVARDLQSRVTDAELKLSRYGR